LALALAIPSAAAAVDPPASASWHGRAIEAPRPQNDAVTTADSFPRGWSAGAVRMGTGLRHPGGSERVREVQKSLWHLGYRPGPVDGLFGPQTLAAVQWFQIKHGLPVNGVVDLRTLALLRERTGGAPAGRPVQEPVRGQRPAERGPAPRPQPATNAADRSAKPAGEGGGASATRGRIALVLLLLAAPAALALMVLRRRRTKPPKPRRAAADRKVAAAPAPQAPAASSSNGAAAIAIGYVRAGNGDRAELARHAGAIRRACTNRGWKLAELVRDDHSGPGRTFERPGLAAAMERLSRPGPSRLVVSKLSHLSRSADDLTALFEWFGRNEVQVVVTDVGLDTTTPEGTRAAESVLASVARRQSKTRSNGRNGGGKRNKVEVAAGAGRGGPKNGGDPG
jgi:peptidoglycan hydrolase-like protein with peptidoglycan-binding domain